MKFIFFLSTIVGLSWIGLGHLYLWVSPPFWVSGIFLGLWNLPTLYFLHRKNDFFFPSIFLAEAWASLISGAFGPLGWLSFHFGIAQGLAGEMSRNFKSIHIAIFFIALADNALILLHPNLKFLNVSFTALFVHFFLGIISLNIIYSLIKRI